ncbi:MAG TPA: DUF6415 family natural product biosynthesis protein [Jiangellaceae bacterium]
MELHLGALLVEVAGAIEEHVEGAAKADIRRAIDMRDHPGDAALARLIDRLLTHCTTLANGVGEIPADERPQRGTAAVEYWHGLRDTGPTDGALANWSYARQLALVARDMLGAVSDHRTVARRRADGTFVGRPALPPLAPETR